MHDRRVGRAENRPGFDDAARKPDQLALLFATPPPLPHADECVFRTLLGFGARPRIESPPMELHSPASTLPSGSEVRLEAVRAANRPICRAKSSML
jgi:hypothetical protein